MELAGLEPATSWVRSVREWGTHGRGRDGYAVSAGSEGCQATIPGHSPVLSQDSPTLRGPTPSSLPGTSFEPGRVADGPVGLMVAGIWMLATGSEGGSVWGHGDV
jgi:hypothetical protein